MENDEKKSTEVKQQSKIFTFIINHKLVFTLFLILIILIIYHLIHVSSMESEYYQRIDILEKQYELQIDSININNLQQTARIFSWAVRSELNRNNLEEINNFFLTFVKEKGIKVINLVDPNNGKIILSTDKKIQGEQIMDSPILNVATLKVIEHEGQLAIVTPILGLDKKIGILVVEIEY